MPEAADIMRTSPLDASPCSTAAPKLVQMGRPVTHKRRFVPSRFNARATSPDGRMVVWNTYTGAITAFEPGQVEVVEGMLSQQGFSAEKKGLAEYLHKRGYLVDEGTSERHRLQLTFGKQHYRTDILSLILMTSEDCNFRCVYCYEKFERGTMSPEVREGIKNLVRKRGPQLRNMTISYFGGEPLYGWEAVEDLAPFLQNAAREYGLRYACSMTTNGYLLTPDVADKLLAWDIRDFQITLDGPAEFHDRKRKARDGGPTWHVILDNLRAMRARDDRFSITIRVNYDQENAPALPEFVRHMGVEFGQDPRFHIAFHAVGQWGGPEDSYLNVCGIDEEKSVRKEMDRTAIVEGFEVRGLQSMTRPGTGVCYAARPYNFIVGASGQLMKCTVVLDHEDFNIVGRILPDGEMELDEDKLALWTEPAFENDSGCAKCYMVPVCQGMNCPLIRIQSGNRPCPPVKRTLQSSLLDLYETGKTRVGLTHVSPAATR